MVDIREVWDGYLSSGAAAPEPSQGNSKEQQCNLCLWLLERFDATNCSLEISSVHAPLTPKEVETVLDYRPVAKKCYNATNHGISVQLLEDRLATADAGHDFKRPFVLYVLGTLLSPTARLDVSPSFLHFLTNMDLVHQYNWGEEEISERQKREKELGGYGSEELPSKKKQHYMEFPQYRDHSNGLPIITESTGIGHVFLKFSFRNSNNYFNLFINELFVEALYLYSPQTSVCVGTYAFRCACIQAWVRLNEDILDFPRSRTMLSGDVDFIVESIREYGCNENVDCRTSNNHEVTCIYSPCTCPLQDCNYVGSFEQLPLHFSCKHWDSGRRFKYNYPLAISLLMDQQFLILQTEQHGVLFLHNKGTETNRFVYEIVSCRGRSSLRLKSVAENFPGRMKDFPRLDFILIPFSFIASSGELNIDIICIWNSTKNTVDYTIYDLDYR
uniref:SIAH-type domain-containing protein n=1 Tax=Phaseolus vulgaris TaxID=3885 RepID=V7BE24_PHAVU|nr:hypothetical protein PHAVU_007G105300g [Phaseolus vulgaris]ESW15825.1 hypothetical protein PHAVU_007G105300g [Phaseolus vulgaris]